MVTMSLNSLRTKDLSQGIVTPGEEWGL